MVIFRKFATLLRIWSAYGAGTVLGLVQDNLRAAGRAFSWRLRRLTHSAAARRRLGGREPGRLHILYVATAQEARYGQTSRYRIYNLMQALRGRAAARLETLEEGIGADTLRWADLAVLMRAPRSRRADRFFETAAQAGVPVVFDIDDLIFLPDYFDAFRRTRPDITEKDAAVERRLFEGFYENFRRSDCATASTPYIAERMRAEGKTAFVVRNGLNARQMRIAARAVKRRKSASGVRTILYLSGSRTHERDFAQALPALGRILAEFADVRLRVVGYLDLSALPAELAARTDTLPFMEWGRMLAFSAQSTVNIAPLDIENPFCHAKSELKYFEAALAGLPTVASATDTFRRCIRHGDNGLLAETEEDWYQALKALLTDDALYAHVREAARQDALRRYTPDAVAGEALKVYETIAAQARARRGAEDGTRTPPAP